MIYHHRRIYPVQGMCQFFGVSRSGYYDWIKRMNHEERDSAKKELVKAAWQHSHCTYGYRRITACIWREKGLRINHKAVLRLMQVLGIRSVARKRRYYKHWEEKPYNIATPIFWIETFKQNDPIKNGSPILLTSKLARVLCTCL